MAEQKHAFVGPGPVCAFEGCGRRGADWRHYPQPYRITEAFAFVVIDEDGDEGIPAFQSGQLAMPLLGADMARVDDLRPIAQQVADETGRQVRLLHFTKSEVIERLEPRQEVRDAQ